jgi:hypothetical protein
MPLGRSDWLLTFLGVAPTGAAPVVQAAAASPGLDPIRVMKGMFLFQNEDSPDVVSPLPGPPYEFEAYAYGPFTVAIYHDLKELQALGFVQSKPVLGRPYSQWSITENGTALAVAKVEEVPIDRLRRLRHAKQIVLSKGFAELLRYVYKRHPEYATESVAKL